MRHCKWIRWAAAILLTVFAVTIALGLGVSVKSYRPTEEALEIIQQEGTDGVGIERLKNGDIVFMPEKPCKGLIFYPGGFVRLEAYAPLMKSIAENGVLCVLTKMPLNLAVLDIKAADGYVEAYPEIKEWYIGGHSLGGAMAANYVSKNDDDFEGLILLAAFSTADLSDSCIEVISIYGSEDGVLNRDSYEKYSVNLPDETSEIVLVGGNHSGFGSYGDQKGDGEAFISNEEQLKATTAIICEFLKIDGKERSGKNG